MKYIAIFCAGIVIGVLIVITWALCAAKKIDEKKDDSIDFKKR